LGKKGNELENNGDSLGKRKSISHPPYFLIPLQKDYDKYTHDQKFGSKTMEDRGSGGVHNPSLPLHRSPPYIQGRHTDATLVDTELAAPAVVAVIAVFTRI